MVIVLGIVLVIVLIIVVLVSLIDLVVLLLLLLRLLLSMSLLLTMMLLLLLLLLLLWLLRLLLLLLLLLVFWYRVGSGWDNCVSIGFLVSLSVILAAACNKVALFSGITILQFLSLLLLLFLFQSRQLALVWEVVNLSTLGTPLGPQTIVYGIKSRTPKRTISLTTTHSRSTPVLTHQRVARTPSQDERQACHVALDMQDLESTR